MKQIVFSLACTRSNHLLIYFMVIHCLMLVTIFTVFGLSLGSLWSIVIIVSFIIHCKQYQWIESKKACIKLERDATEKWAFTFKNGEIESELVLKNSVVNNYFVVLNFHRTTWWKPNSITIMNDAVDSGLFRQLRIYCRKLK